MMAITSTARMGSREASVTAGAGVNTHSRARRAGVDNVSVENNESVTHSSSQWKLPFQESLHTSQPDALHIHTARALAGYGRMAQGFLRVCELPMPKPSREEPAGTDTRVATGQQGGCLDWWKPLAPLATPTKIARGYQETRLTAAVAQPRQGGPHNILPQASLCHTTHSCP